MQSELLRKGDCKEVRFTIKTEQKDLQMKADMTRRLMERGYRVKCMAMGNEDQDLGSLLSRLAALIEDVSFVESGPRVEKRQAYMIVRHAKFGPSKSKPGQKTAKVTKASTLPQASASPSSRSDAISTGPDVEVESESETETEYEDVNNDGTKEFASADVEEIDSEFGDRVPWSDFAAQNSSQASFTSENFDVNTEFGSKEITSSIHEDHLPDAGLFSNDASNGSKIAAIDEILAGVDNSISSESGRGKYPVRSSSNMNRAGMGSKFITSEGPRKPHWTPISDPTRESQKPAFDESRDAKGFKGHTLDGMPLHPETRSAENNLLDRRNHLRGGMPQIKPPKEVFGQVHLSGTQHDSPTVRRPLHVDQDVTKTIGGLQSGKKTLREESVSSGPTISSCGESSGVSADSAPRINYGVFSASKNMASGDGSSQGKKNRDTSSSVTSGMPDSNDINVNRNKSSPETDNANVHDNGKARQGGWGIFSKDSSNSYRQRSSTDR
ncbi:hypothetical protein EJ110_NYTH09346 [Nymphaea thermarum]|nr:hypothetical protein EJ110_NYTH09346 [Nymphaea thermarum]